MDYETLLEEFRESIKERALTHDDLQGRARALEFEIENGDQSKIGYHKACLSMIKKDQSYVYAQFQTFRASYLMICKSLKKNGCNLSMEDQLLL